MSEVDKAAERSKKPIKCSKCGEEPWVIKEQDGYWYVGCTIQCNSESEWDRVKKVAIEKWNETHNPERGE